jgi:VanZ family protein
MGASSSPGCASESLRVQAFISSGQQMWQAGEPAQRVSFVPTHRNELQRRPLVFTTHVLPAAAYASALFYVGLIRIGALPEVGFVATDKLLHALAFGGLALLLARATHFLWPAAPVARKLLVGGAGSSLLGLVLELLQSCTLYRSGDVWDWLADTVGAAFSMGVAFAVLTWRPRRAHG